MSGGKVCLKIWTMAVRQTSEMVQCVLLVYFVLFIALILNKVADLLIHFSNFVHLAELI